MSDKPDVQLLPNGDILVPVEAEDTESGWRVSRVSPDDDDYADWLRVVQGAQPADASKTKWHQRLGVRLLIVAVVLILVAAWRAGTFDQALYKVGLNAKECARNGLGATFCGQELTEYRDRITKAKEEGEAAASKIKQEGEASANKYKEEAAKNQSELESREAQIRREGEEAQQRIREGQP
jgi:hypothetical protein